MKFRHNPSSKIIGEVPLEDVFSRVMNEKRRGCRITIEKRTYSADRMRVFALHGCKCHFCGREGTKIILTEDGGGSLHLDLYAVEANGYILMNRDHIKPQSLGGGNEVFNMRPTCAPCNSKRGNKYTKEDKHLFSQRQRAAAIFHRLCCRQWFAYKLRYKVSNWVAKLPLTIYNPVLSFLKYEPAAKS